MKKRKKVEEHKEEYKTETPDIYTAYLMIKPMLDKKILPERFQWSYKEDGVCFGNYGSFPWACLEDLSDLIVDIFERETKPIVNSVSDAYSGIMERVKKGEIRSNDIEMLPLVIKEMRRL